MKKLSTSEIISIASIVVSIVVVVLEEKTNKVTKWIIFGLLFAALIIYTTLVLVRHLRIRRGMSSTILMSKTRKYTMKSCVLRRQAKNSSNILPFSKVCGEWKDTTSSF